MADSPSSPDPAPAPEKAGDPAKAPTASPESTEAGGPQNGSTKGPTTTESPRGPPVDVARGARVRLGNRLGTVEVVRGNGPKPYEVRIRWDDAKWPLYVTYTAFERDVQEGRLELHGAAC